MSLIKLPSEINIPTSVMMLIYGQPGVSKTTLGLSSPSPVLLDFDKGVHRVNPSHQVPTLQVESYNDFLDVVQSGELSPFKTVVVDTAGKMLDFMDAYIISNDSRLGKRDGGLTLQGYGVRKSMFRNVLNTLSQTGKHVVFIAHEKEEKDGDRVYIRPDIGGSSAGDLIRDLDLVGYMEMVGANRTISFTPCEKYYAKNGCNLDPKIVIPSIIDREGKITGENNLLTRIFAKHEDIYKKRVDRTADFEKLIKDITKMIAGAKDADGLNKVVADMGNIEHIWNSSMKARTMISKRAKDLDLTFNKETKLYE